MKRQSNLNFKNQQIITIKYLFFFLIFIQFIYSNDTKYSSISNNSKLNSIDEVLREVDELSTNSVRFVDESTQNKRKSTANESRKSIPNKNSIDRIHRVRRDIEQLSDLEEFSIDDRMISLLSTKVFRIEFDRMNRRFLFDLRTEFEFPAKTIE